MSYYDKKSFAQKFMTHLTNDYDLPETWFCDACGSERPDEFISVYKRDAGVEDYSMQPGIMIENLKYCNDKVSCTTEIKRLSLATRHPRKN